MPVDFNGRSTDIFQLKEFAEKNNLLLIEDACHAIGSFYGTKHMGTVSDIGVFSFSTPKIITTGQGGMIVTNDTNIFEKCLLLKDFGRESGIKKNMKKSFMHETIGYNFKFTEFQAAVGIAQMKKLKSRIKRKKEIFQQYKEFLSKIKKIKFVNTDIQKTTPWMIDILCSNGKIREDVINYLDKNNIETRIFYPPIHSLNPYKTDDKKFSISTDISKRGLWLPSSNTLTDNQLEYVCEKIKQFLMN